MILFIDCEHKKRAQFQSASNNNVTIKNCKGAHKGAQRCPPKLFQIGARNAERKVTRTISTIRAHNEKRSALDYFQ